MTIRASYEAVIEYDDEAVEEHGIHEEHVRENLLDLIRRDPSFGTITVERVDNE